MKKWWTAKLQWENNKKNMPNSATSIAITKNLNLRRKTKEPHLTQTFPAINIFEMNKRK